MSGASIREAHLSPKRSRICFVCHDDSKNFHLNYGSPTCSSCRAFFRRAYRRSESSKLVCQYGGTCEITPKSRRNCAKCRFDQCIGVGMKVSLVLDESQKQQRFRRSLKKKRGQEAEGPSLDGLKGEGSLNIYIRQASDERRDEAYFTEDGSNKSGTDVEERSVKRISAQIFGQTQEFKKPPREILEVRWEASVANLSIDPRLFNNLCSLHSAQQPFPIGYLSLHMSSLRQIFLDFAKLSSRGDQQGRYQSNLFLAAILANYAIADTGCRQIAWLTLNTTVSTLPTLSFLVFSRLMKIFRSDHSARSFLELAMQLQPFCKDISNLAQMAEFCFEGCLDSIQGAHFRQIMIKLADYEIPMITETQLGPIRSFVVSSPRQLSHDECGLIKSHMRVIMSSFKKVPFGEKLIRDFVLITIHKQPMTLQSAWHLMGVWSQRVLMILQQFEEFQEISPQQKNAIWESSFLPFYSVVCAKTTGMESVANQITFITNQGDQSYMSQISHPFDLKCIKPRRISEFNKKSPYLSMSNATRMEQIYANMGSVVQDEIKFALTLLCQLFKSAAQQLPHMRIGKLGKMFQMLMDKVMSSDRRDNRFYTDCRFQAELSELVDLFQSAAL